MTQPDQDGLQAAPPDDAGTGEQHPDWLLADKYKSVEEQAKAYPEANTRLQAALADVNRERQERERLEQQLSDFTELMQEQRAPAQQQQGFGNNDWEQHPLVVAYQQALDNGDATRALAVQTQLMDGLLEQRLQAMQAQQQDTAPKGARLDPFHIQQLHERVASGFKQGDEEQDQKLRDDALGLLSADPVLSNALKAIEENPNAMIGDLEPIVSNAYALAQAKQLQAGQQSLAQQQAAQENARQRKLEQESLSGTGPTRVAPKSEQDAAWDRIKAAQTGGVPRLANVD